MNHVSPQRPTEPLAEDLPAPDDAPDDDAFDPSDAAKVHAALSTLRAEHRDVLLLRFMESMTYEQIAQVTGAEFGTVRSRIHYAKLALRRELEKDHDHAHA